MNDRDKMNKDAATILVIIKYLLIFGIIGLAIYYGSTVLVVLLPFVVGLILAKTAFALGNQWKKLVRFLQKKTRIGKWFPVKAHGLSLSKRDSRPAVIFYYLVVIAMLAAVFGLITALIGQIRSLANYLPDLIRDTSLIEATTSYLADISRRLGGVLTDDSLLFIQELLTSVQAKLVEALPGIVSTMLNSIGRFLSNLPAIIIALVVILMSGHYFVSDSKSIYRFLYRNIQNRHFVRRSLGLINSLSNTLFRVIGGYVLLLFITFGEALIGLTLIGMPYAVLLSLVAAVLDFLPLLGISATMIPIIVYLFINGNILGGIGAIITLVVISVVRRFIEPPILGNAMRLHPMATLFSMILGVSAYGLSGILIGPIVLVIVKEVFSQFGLDRQVRQLLFRLLRNVKEQPVSPEQINNDK
jgi:sporulation integral membrane protein YtvI